MAFFGASDFDNMLSAFGVPCAIGDRECTLGVLRVVDDELLVGEASRFAGKIRTVLVRTGTLKLLKEGVTLTVDGTNYRVHSARQEANGVLTRAVLIPV